MVFFQKKKKYKDIMRASHIDPHQADALHGASKAPESKVEKGIKNQKT